MSAIIGMTTISPIWLRTPLNTPANRLRGPAMKSGDVIWIEFPGVVQTKRRPAVIISSATYHAIRPDVIVGLVTSQTAKANSPTDYLIQDWQAAGLRVASSFRSFIVTLPASAIVSTMGTLTPKDWTEVVARIKLAIELT
jgi:mRNA interferase MazF